MIMEHSYQLKNLINRRNVKTHPKDDFQACDDFFVLVVHSHIIAAAMEILDNESEQNPRRSRV